MFWSISTQSSFQTSIFQLVGVHKEGWKQLDESRTLDTWPSAPPTDRQGCQRYVFLWRETLQSEAGWSPRSKLSSCCVLSNHVHCLQPNSCRAVRGHRQKLVTDDNRLALSSSSCLLLHKPSHGLHINNGWSPFIFWTISEVTPVLFYSCNV